MSPLEVELNFTQLYNRWVDKSVFSFNFHPGGKFAQEWDKGGYELGYSFRLGGLRIVPAFYLQYYNGYSETLLNFNERVQQFRGGLVF